MAMTPAEMEKKLNEVLAQNAVLIEALAAARAGIAPVKPKKFRDSKGKPQKFYTTQDRYVHGKYIRATPEYPALVTFDKDVKIAINDDGKPEDASLIPYEEGKPDAPKTEGLVKPYAEVRRGPKDTIDNGEGRPSDADPAQK